MCKPLAIYYEDCAFCHAFLAADLVAARILGYNPNNLIEDGTSVEEIRSAFPEQYLDIANLNRRN